MRSFTIESIKKTNGGRVNYTGGRFISEMPSGAARKVFTKAFHYLKGKSASLKITIRETTQGSLKKEYKYRVTKKAENITVERDGVEITFKFTTKIKSIK